MSQNLTSNQILDILTTLTPTQISEISQQFGPSQIAIDLHNVLTQIIYLQPQTQPAKYK